MRKRFFVSLFLLGLSGITLYANVTLPFGPDSGGGVPAYARIERLPNGEVLVHNDGTWAAITFYRDPECVPADFNLLDFFDAPRAFECTLTVEGFEIWRNGPWAGDTSPIQTVSYGLGAVPIWFVELSELQTAINDGVLTVSELGGLSSLKKGSAVFFKETLHPFQSAKQTKTQIVAQGILDAGGSFFFQAEETHNQLRHVRIRFS
jgi:hypothetical protein